MLGLPIPAAASVLVFMVIVSHNAGSYQLVSEGSTALIVLVLSALMVSRVRFRSFKELRLNLKTVGILLLVVGACAAIVMAGLEKAFIFLFLVLCLRCAGLGGRGDLLSPTARPGAQRAPHPSTRASADAGRGSPA
jgi:phosphatidylserine synthase